MQMRSVFFALLVSTLLVTACSDDDPASQPDAGQDMSENNQTDMPEVDMPGNDMGNDDMNIETDMAGDMGTDPTRETCDDVPTAGENGLACASQLGTNDFTLIHAGTILAPDIIYENGYVLIDDAGQITCTGCDCAADANAAAANTVSCVEGVVSPGLINGHEHIQYSLSQPQTTDERFDHRQDWRRGLRGHSSIRRSPGTDNSYAGMMYVELRNVFAGATTIVGNPPDSIAGMMRNLDGNPEDTEGLAGVDVAYTTFPLGDFDPDLRTGDCQYPNVDGVNELENAVYYPHIAEGIDNEARNEYLCLSGAAPDGVDLVESNTTIVHGIGLTAADIADMAASGAKLVWSPRTNVSLYGMTARIPLFKHYGVTIAMGTDWSASGSAEMLRELKCADYMNQNHFGALLTDKEIWEMATYNGAVAFAVDNQIGSLQAGKLADITIFDGSFRQDYRAVIDATPADVLLVLRGGEPLVGDANVIEGLIPADTIDTCETLDICNRPRRLCTERETGLTFSAIRSAVDQNALGPWYCDTPPNEPSCVPFRPMEYTGVAEANDNDGDGLTNDIDVCVDIFTPLRPIEGTMQMDSDADGIGDECDVCPLTPGDTCEPFDPNDRDSDTIDNDQDNCPNIPNMGQEDMDNDGIGDVCDRCPMFDNTTISYCPATVYEVRDGTYPLSSEVRITDVIVTAQLDDTYYMQVDPTAASFTAAGGSGIQLYLRNAGGGAVPAVGDRITVTGLVDSFGDQLQISTVSELTIDSSGNTLPMPVEVAPADIATGGAQADDLQGVLVRVIDVDVTDNNPDVPDDYGEFLVTGGLRVDDYFYAVAPRPTLNDRFAYITGILGFSFGNTKLFPRDMADVALGPPVLTDFGPVDVFLAAGSTNSDSTPALEVVLSNAPLADTTVGLTYSGSVSGPAAVVVPAGTTRINVPMTAGAVGAGTVTAALDAVMLTANVTVYDAATLREVNTLGPNLQDLAINSTLTMTVTLTVPAGAAGETINLTYAPGTQLSGPAMATVPAGALSVDFVVTGGAVAGVETVTATLGASMAQATVNVVEPPSDCLIISEYLEGSGSNNKALELYNCSGVPLELDKFGVCLVSNAATTCSAQIKLGTKSLAFGQVHTLCKTMTGPAGDPVDLVKANCDEASSSVLNFNGDDRLIVYVDVNDSGTFDSGDTIADAFGETGIRPATAPWGDQTLRRCNFTQYDGSAAFSASTYYTSHPQNNADDYGTPPTEGCP